MAKNAQAVRHPKQHPDRNEALKEAIDKLSVRALLARPWGGKTEAPKSESTWNTPSQAR